MRTVGKDAGRLRQQGIREALLEGYLEQLVDGLLAALRPGAMEGGGSRSAEGRAKDVG